MRGNGAHRLRGTVVALVALATSVGLHLALVALLPWRGAAPGPRARVVPFAVELRPSTPGRAPPAPPAPVAPAEPPAPAGPRAHSGDARRAAAGPSAASAPAAAARDELHRNALEGLEVPSAASGPEAPPDLHVRWPDGPPGAGDASRPETPHDALRGLAAEQAGRARVSSGLVHPYFRALGRALLGAWNAERVIERRGISGFLAQAGENVRAFGRVWQRTAEGFATTGAPALVDGGSERMKELSGLPPGPARDSLVAAETRRQLRPAFSEGHVTLVRVTQAPDGRLLTVELLSPSSDPEVDRAAVADVRAAARHLPAPPADARGTRETLVSTWELELEISITPPLPLVEVELDEVLGLGDVRLPLDRRIWKRVRLVALN